MSVAAMQWTWARLPSLGPLDVYDMLALRSNVFVMEQNCPFLDADGADIDSWHLLGRDAVGGLAAYLRVVDPGIKYAEPSIGRVMTRLSDRRTGLGITLMREGIARAQALWPGHVIRIGAQHRLEKFYQAFGFVSDGAVYIEDNIPHIEMVLASPLESLKINARSQHENI